MNPNQFFETFGRMFFPQQWREPIRQYLLKAGYETMPYRVFGMLFFVAVGITYGLFIGLFVPALKSFQDRWAESGTAVKAGLTGLSSMVFWIVVLFGLIGLVVLATYFVLNLKIYQRVREMEVVLPEYLSLVVTNLKSGMNFEQSLWAAVRPEFGILSREITLVSKRVMTGNDTAEALHEFIIRYESPTLRRNFNLIISEIQSGGEIAVVIERVIASLKKTKDLKEEMSASVLNFMIFIAVIVVVLAPVLFALANTLLTVIMGFAELLARSVGTSSGIGSSAAVLTKMAGLAEQKDVLLGNFKWFSYAALGIIAFFSSMIVSIIEKGDVRGGVKYIPLFTITALVLFAIFSTVFQTFFGGMLG